MQTAFHDADTDKSGALDATELSEVVKLYYKKEGISRSLSKVCKRKNMTALTALTAQLLVYFFLDLNFLSSKVEAEVAAAMLQFDRDKNGTLDFTEFLML